MGKIIRATFATPNNPITVYSIGGFFVYRTLSNADEMCRKYYDYKKIIFGGYFRHRENNGALLGRLNDHFGPSRIKGMMLNLENRRELDFDKIYNERTFHYHFTKKGDIWVGEWCQSLLEKKRYAECRIIPLAKENSQFLGDPSFDNIRDKK